MSLQPREDVSIPDQRRRLALAAFPIGCACLRVAGVRSCMYQDRQFAALFLRRGQPAEAPWRLVLATAHVHGRTFRSQVGGCGTGTCLASTRSCLPGYGEPRFAEPISDMDSGNKFRCCEPNCRQRSLPDYIDLQRIAVRPTRGLRLAWVRRSSQQEILILPIPDRSQARHITCRGTWTFSNDEASEEIGKTVRLVQNFWHNDASPFFDDVAAA